MKAFPIELRQRLLKAVRERTGTVGMIANLFSVSASVIYKLQRQFHATQDLTPKPHSGGGTPLLRGSKLEQLRQLVKAQPDATLEELQQRLQQQAGVKRSPATICRALQKLDLRRKKKRFFAQERKPRKRREFRQKVAPLDARKMVFIDEMGVNLNLTRLYARAPGAQRVQEALP